MGQLDREQLDGGQRRTECEKQAPGAAAPACEDPGEDQRGDTGDRGPRADGPHQPSPARRGHCHSSRGDSAAAMGARHLPAALDLSI